MKKLILLIAVCFAINMNAQKAEIENTVKTFFEGFHAKDTMKIKSVCAEKMILQSIIEGQKATRFEDEKPSEFYKSFSTFPADLKFEERILSYNIQIDGRMAHVWAPYEFYVNGKLSHSGVNAFTLYNDNGFWKIIYLIDTRRKSAK